MIKIKKPFFITFCFFAWSSFASGLPSQEVLSEKQILKIGNSTEAKDLDPSTTIGVPEARVEENLFEGLTAIDPFTEQIIPAAATAWKISPDGKIYTFTLRNDLKWSDGTSLTAKDFVASWERTLRPETAAEYAYQLYYIENAEAYNKGQIKDASQIGVKALDSLTLEVRLREPTPFFISLTAFHALYPTPTHVIAKLKNQKEWTRPANMVCNGPFKLAEWNINQHIKLVPNEHYWDKKNVKLKEVYFYPIENLDTEEKTFQAGELDLTANVPSLKIPQYEKEKIKNQDAYHPFKTTPYLGSYFFIFNTQKKPTDDSRVRKALALTIDRTLITERIVRGGQTPATHFTPPGCGGYSYNGPTPLTASVGAAQIAEAKKLLAEAGYPEGRGMPKVEILYNTSEDHKRIAVAVQQMWKQNLGIDVGLFNQEWKVYLDTQKKRDYTISRYAWIGDYPDPNTFLDMYVTAGGNNNTGWSSTAYDQLIKKAAQTTDQKQRFEAFSQAEQILLDQMPIAPIYFMTKNTLVSHKIRMIDQTTGTLQNWRSNITDRLRLKHYVLVK